MKFFLDTANLNEIREGVSLGLVDGVTTNPSLVAKEGGVDFKQHVAAICELVRVMFLLKSPVSTRKACCARGASTRRSHPTWWLNVRLLLTV